jgi:hypothetical protein
VHTVVTSLVSRARHLITCLDTTREFLRVHQPSVTRIDGNATGGHCRHPNLYSIRARKDLRVTKIKKSLVATMVGALTLVGLTTGAPAASASSSCVNLWEDTIYGGRSGCFNPWSGSNYTTLLLSGSSGTVRANDRVSSIYNGTRYQMCFYSDINFRGRYLILPPGAAVKYQLPYMNLNDQISSHRPC